jgi:hypothetical protein
MPQKMGTLIGTQPPANAKNVNELRAKVNAVLTLTGSRCSRPHKRRVRNKKWTPRGASKVLGGNFRLAATKRRQALQL